LINVFAVDYVSAMNKGRRALWAAVIGLIAWFVLMMPVGVLGSSNLVWGEPNQYGRVDVPGTAVLHLPAGTVDITAAVYLPGKGNETVTLPIPSGLSVSVAPVDGGAQPVVTEAIGTSGNTTDNTTNAIRTVWKATITRDGQYRITTGGSFTGIGIHPQLWFGHGPPLPGIYVPVVAAVLVVLGALVWLPVRRWSKRRKTAAAMPADHPVPPAARVSAGPAVHRGGAGLSADQLARLTQLTDLHQRGTLSDAEFRAEKARILDRR
jgi:hypothetical protein